MEIRKVEQKDLESIKELWIEFINYHKDLDSYFTPAKEGADRFIDYISNNLNNPDFCLILGEEGGKVIGYLLGQVSSRPPVFEISKEALITDITFRKEYRGQKRGDQLIKWFVQWSKDKGLSHIVLQVLPGNEIGRKFYSRLGFKDFLYNMSMKI